MQLAMFCKCCAGRNYWFKRAKINSSGSLQLRDLADQAEEFLSNDMDIRSDNTVIAEDHEDYLFDFNEDFGDSNLMRRYTGNSRGGQPTDDTYFRFSQDDDD